MRENIYLTRAHPWVSQREMELGSALELQWPCGCLCHEDDKHEVLQDDVSISVTASEGKPYHHQCSEYGSEGVEDGVRGTCVRERTQGHKLIVCLGHENPVREVLIRTSKRKTRMQGNV